jgi:hypothetical protein
MPLLSSALGMGVGGEGRYTVSRKFCSAEMAVDAEVSARMLRLDQARPPLPVEADRSRVRESHSPIVLGADTATVGTTALTGLEMLTDVWTEAAGQVLVSQDVPGQRAFRTAADARATLLPMEAQSVPEITIAATVASLIHVQDEVDAQAKLNSELQGKVVPVPPRFELDPKLISTFDPSLLNAAEVRIGAGRGANSGRTARPRPLTPAEYSTSYWYADCPETVTL